MEVTDQQRLAGSIMNIKMENQNSDVFILIPWFKIFDLLMPILIIIVNAVEIYLLRKTLNRQSYEKILLSLSVCDLASGVLALTLVPYMSLIHDELYIVLYWITWRFISCYWT